MAKREPTYAYRCGYHDVTSPKPLDVCPGYVLGERCPGTFKQVGGPRK